METLIHILNYPVIKEINSHYHFVMHFCPKDGVLYCLSCPATQ